MGDRVKGGIFRVILLLTAFSALSAGQTEGVKSLGKTAAGFETERLRVAIDWIDFALRPEEKWAFLELWIMPLDLSSIVIKREDISLILPDGSRLAIPGQAELTAGLPDIRRIMAMTDVPQERLGNTFRPRTSTQRFGFHEIPGAPRTVYGSCTIGQRSAGYGDIFFASPKGSWEPGMYTLEVKNEDIDVAIPFPIGMPREK